MALIARPIAGAGTAEAAWQAWPGLHALPSVCLDDLIPSGGRLVVVAPHPDDEVLGCGGLLAMIRSPRTTVLVAVTDGDASHPGSVRWTAAALAAQRRSESAEGLRRLGAAPSSQLRLGLPDGAVAQHEATIGAALDGLLAPGDTVLATWSGDGHPDHEASGRAAAAAAARAGCRLLQMPIWTWHWAAPADDGVPWSRLVRLQLDRGVLDRKRAAIAAHRSQLEDQPGPGAVLPPWVLSRLLRPCEYFLLPEVILT